MPVLYELIYGFVHCRGRTTYSAGYVNTLGEAEAWLKKIRKATSGAVIVPPEDPVRYCKAAWCPFKRQKPWFEIRDLQKPEESE
ncbi:MAG TPA: hypothetical protein PLG94_06250 [Smithellaceae bacterium]|nr:hypothetical protein [Smithellaceae bacterium]HPL66111.1 hypothetical protein [Smithellaceae bacterium]